MIGNVAKRAFDAIVATIALIVLAPLLLIAALAVKLNSPGPVFFTQPRIGVLRAFTLGRLDRSALTINFQP